MYNNFFSILLEKLLFYRYKDAERRYMRIDIPEGANKVIEGLEAAGYEAYIVGGCVRDSILGREPGDWDITTSARPEQVKEIFRRTVDTGIEHGTVTVMMGKEGYEVTTYRIDGEYSDHRRPDQVEFTASLEEDLKRRDFTINAMAYSHSKGIIDMFGGVQDLNDKVIRAVGVARDRFDEDALRILRAIRFAGQLGFDIERDTRKAMIIQAQYLKDISAERIRVELTKLLVSDHPDKLLEAYVTGITAYILPEFDKMMEQPQNNQYHRYNVGVHSIEAVKNIRADVTMRWAALLHDIGKPSTHTVDENGTDHFYDHQIAGVPLAEAVLRKLLGEVGKDFFPYIIEIKKADMAAQSDYKLEERQSQLAELEKKYEEIVADADCVRIKDLKVNGGDLIKLGIKPGPQMGEILQKLLDMVIEDPEKNDREYLLDQVKQM